MTRSKQKVLVMMSGGVDSSVAALLLRDQGYAVTGVFMKNWSPHNLQSLTDCPWQQDLADARQVAAQLGIAFRSVNFEREYRRYVIRYFLAEYQAGRTPNPDMLCNAKIKFGVFARWALAQGANYIASGHYARVVIDRGHRLVGRGADRRKDQSYFLAQVEPAVWSHTLFPLGDLLKVTVRQLATDQGLVVATKKDSQGICFVGQINVGTFLRAELGVKPGAILSPAGTWLGRHDGTHLYTIGQRHGFHLKRPQPLARELGYDDTARPAIYVLKKDMAANTVTVGTTVAALATQRFSVLEPVFYLAERELVDLRVQIRYQGAAVPCTLMRQGEQVIVETSVPVTAVASGQFAVFYQREAVIGSGRIGGCVDIDTYGILKSSQVIN